MNDVCPSLYVYDRGDLLFNQVHTFQKSGCCSVAQLCSTLCGPMDCSTPGSSLLLISCSLLKFTSIEKVMPSNRFILGLFSFCFQFSQEQSLFQLFGSLHQGRSLKSETAPQLTEDKLSVYLFEGPISSI